MDQLRSNTLVTLANKMVKDIPANELPKDKGIYTHAINAVKTSIDGKNGLSSEPMNTLCGSLPAGLDSIGNIPLTDRQRQIVFLTNDEISEIGIFDEVNCSYKKVINDPCLGFKRSHPITGSSKQNFECEEEIYFVDDLSANRKLNLAHIPYTYTLKQIPGQCDEKIYSKNVDCNELLWTPKLKYPVAKLKIGGDGQIRNGVYQATVAYSENKQRITDWFSVTPTDQGKVFSHENRGVSLDITIDNLDRDFNQYVLAIVYTVNQQTTVEIVGYYSTGQNKVSVSKVGNIAPDRSPVNLSDITQQSIYYEKAEQMVSTNGYALLVSPSKPTIFNYQPQANNVKISWVAVKKPADYYAKGGTETGLPRDEVVSVGIQWLRSTGHWTPTTPFIGRRALATDRQIVNGPDIFESKLANPPDKVYRWQAYNTATIEKIHNTNELWAEGQMGYYESTEKYGENNFIWGDLACTPILHPVVPDPSLVPLTDKDGNILLIGLKITNLEHPKDATGNYIPDIVGYRIVIADTTNNKRILAKGIIHNCGEYTQDGKQILYPNYPGNDLRDDPYLSVSLPVRTVSNNERNYTPLNNFRQDVFTFYSPETSFAQPTLGSEFRIYNELFGESRGNFEYVYKHPRHKLIRNAALLAAAAVGFGEAILSTKGRTVYEKQNPTQIKLFITKQTATDPGTITTTNTPSVDIEGISDNVLKNLILAAGGNLAPGAVDAIVKLLKGKSKNPVLPTDTALIHGVKKITTETAYQNIPIIALGAKIFSFAFFFAQGVSTTLNIIKAFVNYEQYAYQYNSHALLNQQLPAKTNNLRRHIDHYEYLYPIIQEANGTTINNYKRASCVLLFLNQPVVNPTTPDTTRQTISTAGLCGNKFGTVITTSSAYYGAIKTFLPAQYGQIDGIRYLDTGYKVVNLVNVSKDNSKKFYDSDVILAGGEKITRSTHKNKMHFFNQTEFNEIDGHEFDYTKYTNVPYPRFWMNSQEYDVNELLKLNLPTDKHNLDCRGKENIQKKISAPFLIKDAAFYLFCNGVLDFYTSSEYDLTKRDWEDTLEGHHYDDKRYSNLSLLFRHDIMDYDNKYLYDRTLLKKTEENFIDIQDQSEDGIDLCGDKFENRVAYSLPNIQGSKKDSWRSFLANNYYDFPRENGKLTGVYPLGQTDILFTFENGVPYIHQAQDTLQTDNGVKVNIGDGGLFDRKPVPVAAYTDYAYGSNQSRFGACATEFGLIYPSQKAGTIFIFAGQLKELTDINESGMYYWAKEYLPSRLLQQFPEFPDYDNPTTGIGLISTFDPTTKILYMSKKDFKAKAGVTFNGTHFVKNGVVVSLGDPEFFTDCSWVVSIDPTAAGIISFHDWHPDLFIQTNKHFLSIKDGQIWKHNQSTAGHCNFYGKNYPFEVEYVVNNVPNNQILSSIEYYLDVFRYSANGKDRFKILDYNFNRMWIYNDEQISGMLKLNLSNKRGPSDFLRYPKVNTDSIDIVYSKEENKIRVNMFADMATDRGEFSGKEIVLINNQEDGYHRTINPLGCNYLKPPGQRKKFRNFWHKVVLRRIEKDGDLMPKMIINFINNKQVQSIR